METKHTRTNLACDKCKGKGGYYDDEIPIDPLVADMLEALRGAALLPELYDKMYKDIVREGDSDNPEVPFHICSILSATTAAIEKATGQTD